MDEVISSYLTALDELNVLSSTSYQMAGGDYSAAIMKIFDVNIDADGEKRTLFDKIKEALDKLFA